MLLDKVSFTLGKCLSVFGYVAILSTGTHELEEILKECDEFILSFAVGEEEREEDGEVTGSDHDIFGEFFRHVSGVPGVFGYILN